MDAPFFVVGCPRSGTTLLSVLLDRHSRLCVPPETGFFDEVAPRLTDAGDEALLEILRHWSRLRELQLEPEQVLRRLGKGSRGPGEVLAAILDLYAQLRGKACCGEKTPQHLSHVSIILQLFPRARILCLLRDGREVALSLRAMPWWGPQTLTYAADVWKQAADLAAGFVRQYPTQFKVVRYEALAKQPESTLRVVMDYLGESFEPSQLDPAIQSHVVLPRSIQWKGQALGPVQNNGTARRRARATAEELAALEQALGDTLHRHGYT